MEIKIIRKEIQELEIVLCLADLNMGKVDANKLNASEVMQDSNGILSGIPIKIVKSSVGPAKNDFKKC